MVALVIVVLNLDKFNTCCSIVVLPCIMFPNPGNDIACIAQKRKTSSCCTALLLMGESPRVSTTSDFKGKKLHLSNETVPAMGEGNENSKKAMTTAIGADKNINISGAAFGAENHALEKDVDFSKKRGRGIYVAKRRAKHRARQKKCVAAQKADNGMERVRAKKRKNPCDDGLLHLPNRSPRECLP